MAESSGGDTYPGAHSAVPPEHMGQYANREPVARVRIRATPATLLAWHRRLIRRPRGCGCRKPRLCRSCGMLVFVDDAAEAVTWVDVEVRDRVWIGERFR